MHRGIFSTSYDIAINGALNSWENIDGPKLIILRHVVLVTNHNHTTTEETTKGYV